MHEAFLEIFGGGGGGRVEMCLSVITCFLVADLNLQRHKSICWTHHSGLWFDGTDAEGWN